MTSGDEKSDKEQSSHPTLKQKFVSRATTIFIIALFAVALAVLDRLFASLTLSDVIRDFKRLPLWQLAAAVGLVLANYLFLSTYDLLGLRFIGGSLSWKKLAPTSILGFVFGNNLGFFGGAGIRFRFYTLLGLKPLEIAQVVGMTGLTYWIGFASLGGLSLLLVPINLPHDAAVGSEALRWIGAGLLTLLIVYLAVGWLGTNEVRVFGRRLVVPSPRIQLIQIFVACTDLLLVSSVLYFCLPPTMEVSYPTLLSAFVVAQVLGLLSHVPGGIGVFESVLVFSLQGPSTDRGALLASLLVFRLLYYVAPLGLAVTAMAVYELGRHISWIRRPRPKWVGPIEPLLVPILATAIVFTCAATLLISGALGPQTAFTVEILNPTNAQLLEFTQPVLALLGMALALLAPGLRMRRPLNLKASLVLLGVAGALLFMSGFVLMSVGMILAVIILLLIMDWYSKPVPQPLRTMESRYRELGGWFFALMMLLVLSIAISAFVYRPVSLDWNLLVNFEMTTRAGSFGRGLRSIALAFAGTTMTWLVLRAKGRS